jgi:uncharacterized protein (DUF1501 family)
MQRRQFLRTLMLGAGGALTLRALPALGQTAQPKTRFVSFYAPGGWDIMMGLDARDPGNPGGTQPAYQMQAQVQFRDVIPTNVVDAQGQPFLAGPCLANLVPHLDVCAVVRSVITNTVSHIVGQNYYLTGRFSESDAPRGSSITTLAASQLSSGRLLPHLGLGGVGTYNVDQPAYATALNINAPSDFSALLGQGKEKRYSDAAREQIRLFQAGRNCSDPREVTKNFLGSQAKAWQTMHSNIASQLDLLAPDASAELQQLRQDFGVDADSTLAAQYAAIAFLALKNGVADAVSIMPAIALDTHGSEWTTSQGPDQKAMFDAIATLIGKLKTTESSDGSGTAMIDQTVVTAGSEFARTPTLNGIGGRDHWPCNAMLLAGGKIRPGVFGQSSDQLLPRNIDPQTGIAVDGDGIALQPENIYTSLLTMHGFDASDLRAQPVAFLQR